ncbi:hypothetical protein Tco_1527311 [Tanacetum coccineum]
MQIEVMSVSSSSSQGTPSSSSSLDGPPPLKSGHTRVDPPVATHEDSVLIKAFLETSVDELTEDQIPKLQEDFNEFENLGSRFS